MNGTPNWLIVGLGNPGASYERTRHNLGFMLIDEIARQAQTQVKRSECRSLVGRAVIENETIELAKPQTFMNLSGEAVKCLIAKPDRSVERLVVISDDLALPLGTIRVRPKGTHAGHNGLRSIIDVLGTSEFIRLRIGIMPEQPVTNAKSFVLENFGKSEVEVVEKVVADSAEAIRAIILDGVEAAMAKHN